MGLNIPFVDITSEWGTGIPFVDFDFNNPEPQVSGASTTNNALYNGSTYYDSATGQMMEYSNGSWSPTTATGSQPLNQTTAGGAYTGSGGTSYDPADMDYLNNQQSTYERLMQSLNSTRDSGIQKLDQSKIQAENNAKDQYGRASRDLRLKREDSQREKQSAIGSVNSNARNLSDSVRRIIGMASGSGSSAYRETAPNAVARQASQQRSGVLNKFGTNERNLDVAETDTRTDFEKLLEEISNQRREREESLRAGVLAQEQGITQSLSEIAAEKARLQGGNALSAMRPYQDRYFGLQDSIDKLPSQYATNVTPRALNTATPKLSDYVVDRQAINSNRQNGQAQYSPYSAFLNRQRDEEEQRV